MSIHYIRVKRKSKFGLVWKKKLFRGEISNKSRWGTMRLDITFILILFWNEWKTMLSKLLILKYCASDMRKFANWVLRNTLTVISLFFFCLFDTLLLLSEFWIPKPPVGKPFYGTCLLFLADADLSLCLNTSKAYGWMNWVFIRLLKKKKKKERKKISPLSRNYFGFKTLRKLVKIQVKWSKFAKRLPAMFCIALLVSSTFSFHFSRLLEENVVTMKENKVVR